jgi:NAD(P)-dependent dehydrogenase (short-subunit alcohol dehydrogenase family)
MAWDLDGQTVLVTGAGRGIGQAAACLLAEAGAHVGVADRDEANVRATIAQIAGAGGSVSAHVGDLSNRRDFERVAGELAALRGAIDAVINNAMWIRYESVGEISEETLDGMLAIGVKAPIWGAQALLRHYDAKRGGALINLASPAADQGYPNTAVYATVKGGIVALTRTLAVELGPLGIRVNAVAPGAVPTPGARAVVDAAGYQARRAKTPLGRLGTEQDIAHAMAFLLSREAAFITGEILHVDGGISVSAG